MYISSIITFSTDVGRSNSPFALFYWYATIREIQFWGCDYGKWGEGQGAF